MKQLKKSLLTLVALLAMTTGAWADDAAFKVSDLKASLGDNTNISLPYEWKESAEQVTVTIAKADGTTGSLSVGTVLALNADYELTVSVPIGGNLSSIAFTTSPASQKNNATASNGTFSSGTWTAEGTTTTSVTFTLTGTFRLTEIAVSYTPAPAAPAAPEVTPTANKNEWTFQMPAYDVELEIEYETALALNEATDNTATLAEWNGYEADVTLTRTLQTGGWNTVALPFSADTTAMYTLAASMGITAVKELKSATLENGTLTLNFNNATSLVAGKPYLVKVAAAVENPTFDGVIVSNDAVPTTTDVVDFIPTLGKTTITGDDANDILFLGSGNTLLHPESLPANMKGFRAYFLLKGEAAEAKAFRMDLGDGETMGIVAIDHSTLNIDHSVYDLQGRRLANGQSSMINGQSLKKGVYVVNGKKVIIK